MDFATHPRRLKKPLIRAGARGNFREASWDEALDYISDKLAALVTEHGGDSVATYACAKATNEDNYVFQKWVRAVLKTNNVDHCARLCHAGSVTGLQLAIGSSAMSNSIGEMENLDTFIVTGSNTTETHPVISLFLKKAVRANGAKLIVIDPRQIELTDFATLWLRQKPGTDVAVFQAMAMSSSARISLTQNSSKRAPRASTTTSNPWNTARPNGRKRSAACQPTISGRPRACTPRPIALLSIGAWASARAPTAPTTRFH